MLGGGGLDCGVTGGVMVLRRCGGDGGGGVVIVTVLFRSSDYSTYPLLT